MLVYSKGKWFEIDLSNLVITSDKETVNLAVHYEGDNGNPRGIVAIEHGKELNDLIKDLTKASANKVTERVIPMSRIITLEMQASYTPVNGKLPKTPTVKVTATDKASGNDLSEVLKMSDLKAVLGNAIALDVMNAIKNGKNTAKKKASRK